MYPSQVYHIPPLRVAAAQNSAPDFPEYPGFPESPGDPATWRDFPHGGRKEVMAALYREERVVISIVLRAGFRYNAFVKRKASH